MDLEKNFLARGGKIEEFELGEMHLRQQCLKNLNWLPVCLGNQLFNKIK